MVHLPMRCPSVQEKIATETRRFLPGSTPDQCVVFGDPARTCVLCCRGGVPPPRRIHGTTDHTKKTRMHGQYRRRKKRLNQSSLGPIRENGLKFFRLFQINTKTPRHKEEGFKNPSGLRAFVVNFLLVRELAVRGKSSKKFLAQIRILGNVAPNLPFLHKTIANFPLVF